MPLPYDSKNMPHGTIRGLLPAVTPHRAESGSADKTGNLNREPRAPNPEVRAPGSTHATPARLRAPCSHLGWLEAAPSPPRGTPSNPSFYRKFGSVATFHSALRHQKSPRTNSPHGQQEALCSHFEFMCNFHLNWLFSI